MQLKEAQQKQVNELVEKLSFTDAKELLKKLALAQPSLVLDVVMKMLEEGGDSDLDPDPELPEWCVCVTIVKKWAQTWKESVVGSHQQGASA